MGSPEGSGRDKYLFKRRKSESSHYLKSCDWDDGEGHEEDLKKSKKSSKGDRERDNAWVKDRENERDRDRRGSKTGLLEKGGARTSTTTNAKIGCGLLGGTDTRRERRERRETIGNSWNPEQWAIRDRIRRRG
ncbi:uncharacterized protein [Physcomitrium patens]|uniref:uncharacterized protein n=1 Tax=Physcomitrium patens TaxID=3218 RepID=UPI00024B0A2C